MTKDVAATASRAAAGLSGGATMMSQLKLNSLHTPSSEPGALLLSRRHFLAGALGGLALLPRLAMAQSWTPPEYRVVVEASELKVSTDYSVDLSIVVPKHGGGEILLYSESLSRTGGSVSRSEKKANFIYSSFELRFSYKRVTNPSMSPIKESVYITTGVKEIRMAQSRPVACSGSVAIKLDSKVSPALVTITLSKT